MSKPNTGVLLATDLGFRCDRATDRAIALARAFGGDATAAAVVEPWAVRAQEVFEHVLPGWHQPTPPEVQAEHSLRREFDACAEPWRVRIGAGRAGAYLSRLLDISDADTLLVTGPVREGVLGPVTLGSTVDALLRRPRITLLMVRRRACAVSPSARRQ